MDHLCTAHSPGALGCYTRHGCRCEPCRAVHARSCKRATVGLSRMVPDVGTRRRLQALAALGWSLQAIADALGVHPRNLQRLRTGRKGGRVQQGTAARVTEVYNRLSMTPPPDTPQTRWRRTTAEQEGWARPLDWDEGAIDDPDARPSITRLGSTKPHGATAEDIAWMVETGESLLGIQRRTGLTVSGIEYALKRAERRDLWRKISEKAA